MGGGLRHSPKAVHVKSRESTNVTLFGKKVLADVMKFKILRWGDYPDYSGGPLNSMTGVFHKRQARGAKFETDGGGGGGRGDHRGND